jgi:hypothetical protein
MAIFVPTISSEHVRLGLIDASGPGRVDNRPFTELLASGCVLFDPAGLANLGQGGDRITVPSIDEPADLEHADHTSSTPLTAAEYSATQDVAVVQHQKKLYRFRDSDRVRSGVDADAEYSQKLGGKIAKRLFANLMRVGVAALDAVDTPTANCHTLSVYDATTPVILKVDHLRQAKAKLGDAAQYLTTACIHSKAYFDLLQDLIANYGGGGVVNDKALVSGLLGRLLGIENWVISDNVPVVTDVTDPTQYNTLLLGPQALWAAYQKEPETERQKDITLPSTVEYLSVAMATVQHLRHVKWNDAGNNPTDANLGDGTKYDEAYDDHRRVLAAKIVTN